MQSYQAVKHVHYFPRVGLLFTAGLLKGKGGGYIHTHVYKNIQQNLKALYWILSGSATTKCDPDILNIILFNFTWERYQMLG